MDGFDSLTFFHDLIIIIIIITISSKSWNLGTWGLTWRLYWTDPTWTCEFQNITSPSTDASTSMSTCCPCTETHLETWSLLHLEPSLGELETSTGPISLSLGLVIFKTSQVQVLMRQPAYLLVAPARNQKR